MTGVVRWFSDKKGYGFISSQEYDKDIFVHYTGIVKDGFKSLIENDEVEFDVIEDEKGRKATNVHILSRRI